MFSGQAINLLPTCEVWPQSSSHSVHAALSPKDFGDCLYRQNTGQLQRIETIVPATWFEEENIISLWVMAYCEPKVPSFGGTPGLFCHQFYLFF